MGEKPKRFSDITGMSWNALLLRPGPNFSDESAIEPCTAQVMQQTCDLILTDPLGSMAQRRGHRRAHARSPHRMGPIIPANDATTLYGVRIVVERHELRQERPWNQERSTS